MEDFPTHTLRRSDFYSISFSFNPKKEKSAKYFRLAKCKKKHGLTKLYVSASGHYIKKHYILIIRTRIPKLELRIAFT